MKWKTSWLLFLFIGIQFVGFGQNINPEYNSIFVQEELTKIELTLDEADKQALVYPKNPYLDIYYQAKIHLQNSKLDTIIGTVGVRIRGNTSRGNQKKSFKIDFKEFGGEQVKHLKKLNLKPNNNDPSMLRESMSWELYRRMNVPAARTSFVELYMNDEFMGVYQNVENIDDEFVNRRFGNEDGNLFKCRWGATLEKSNDINNNDLFELKTNEEVNDRSRLKKLVEVINSSVNSEWEQNMEAIFDVDNYLRQMAVESMIGNWDGYAYNSNNYYLYDNPATNKIHYIPYDLDNTWGIDWIGPDWAKEDLMTWYSDWLDVRLTKQILKSEKYKKIYADYIKEVMTQWFSMKDYMDFYYSVAKDAVVNDRYYSLDYGYSYNDFLEAPVAAWGKHVEYSITDYIDKRYQTASTQVPVADEIKTNSLVNFVIYPNPSDGNVIGFKGSEILDEPELFDSWGRKIRSESTSNGTIQFKNRLPKGIYFLKIGQYVQKLIVDY